MGEEWAETGRRIQREGDAKASRGGEKTSDFCQEIHYSKLIGDT